MKIGDLVRRKFVSQEQKQRFFHFHPTAGSYGLVTRVDEKNSFVSILFKGSTEVVVLPYGLDYLEIVSEAG